MKRSIINALPSNVNYIYNHTINNALSNTVQIRHQSNKALKRHQSIANNFKKLVKENVILTEESMKKCYSLRATKNFTPIIPITPVTSPVAQDKPKAKPKTKREIRHYERDVMQLEASNEISQRIQMLWGIKERDQHRIYTAQRNLDDEIQETPKPIIEGRLKSYSEIKGTQAEQKRAFERNDKLSGTTTWTQLSKHSPEELQHFKKSLGYSMFIPHNERTDGLTTGDSKQERELIKHTMPPAVSPEAYSPSKGTLATAKILQDQEGYRMDVMSREYHNLPLTKSEFYTNSADTSHESDNE
ncbi:chaperone protein ClpB [Acrasis kona]|uniref:Chaperone protein ClpB n=1 Tax=Acrasis kona TaxID=1008807 RepID=A0AAW2ZMY2_9EUKA